MPIDACNGCGARLQVPEGQLLATCAFCGNALERTERSAEAPQGVVPFDLTEIEARALARRHVPWWRRPDDLNACLDEGTLEAIYVPFYAFSARATVDEAGEIAIPDRTQGQERVHWTDCHVAFVYEAEDHLVSGSRGLSEADANALEPWDVSDAVAPSGEILAGVRAEVPDVEREAAVETAARELDAACFSDYARSVPGYGARLASAPEEKFRPEVAVGEAKLVLLPVWVLRFTWGSTPHRWLIQGQTGVVLGPKPTSAMPVLRRAARVGLWTGGGLAGVTGLLALVVVGLFALSFLCIAGVIVYGMAMGWV